MNPAKYGIKRVVKLSYEKTVQKVTETLKEQGFGILTEIDVKATLKKKLDEDIKPYIILGACNPKLALHALTEEPDIGLLLPCNVVVYQDDNDDTVLGAIDPAVMVQITGRDDLDDFASSVKQKLTAALDAV